MYVGILDRMYSTLNYFRRLSSKHLFMAMSLKISSLSQCNLSKLCQSDIDLMYKPGSGRSSNSKENDIRENILVNGPMFSEGFDCPKWRHFMTLWQNTIHSIRPIEQYERIELEQMGGRKHNYDIALKYYDTAGIVYPLHVEFKHNSTSIYSIPQVLSLSANSALQLMTNSSSYLEYYYDNYLDKYLNLMSKLVDKPVREFYLSKVQNPQSKNETFFNALRTDIDYRNKEKTAVVHLSVEEFLKRDGGNINLEWLSNKLKSSQVNKVFVFWDLKQFHTYSFKEADLMLTMDQTPLVTRNEIVVRSENNAYHLNLRWANTLGCLNPAWKVIVKPICAPTIKSIECTSCHKIFKMKKNGDPRKHKCIT